MSDKLQGGIKADSVDVSVPFILRLTSNNQEATGKVAADMTLSYWRQGGTRTAITASDLAAVNSAHTDGGVKEVDATNTPGLYRLDIPDAAVAAGADWVIVTVKVAASYVFHERYSITTNVVQTGDSFARIGAPVGASISADIAGVQSDTNDIQTRLPAALVSGRIDASVGAMAANVLTASALATDAVDEVVDGVWNEPISGHTTTDTTGELLTRAADGGGGAINGEYRWHTATSGDPTSGKIRADQTTPGATTELGIATITELGTDATAMLRQLAVDDVIYLQVKANSAIYGRYRVNALPTDNTTWFSVPVTVVASAGTWPANNTVMAINVTMGVASGQDWSATERAQLRHRIGIDGTASAPAATPSLATATAVAAVQADTDDIQTRLPAALVSGRMDSSVGAMAAGTITATAIATGAIDADALATDAVNEIVDQVWREAIADHSGVAGSTAEQLAAAGAAGDPWATALPGAYTAGQAGKIVGDNLNATVSSRATQTSVDTIDDFLDTEIAAIKAKTDQLVFTTANRVDAQVFGMQADTITASAIATDAIDAAALAADAVTEIQSGLATSAALATVQADTDNIQTRLPAALVSGRMDSSVGAMAAGTITAAAIATDAIDADAIAANAVTEIQSGLATAAAVDAIDNFVDTEVAAIKAVTDKLDTALELDGAVYRYTINALEQAPSGGGGATAADIADAVWDELIAGHLTAGSTGNALNNATAAGNPWEAILDGTYTAGDLQRMIAAYAAGKTSIVKNGTRDHNVTFRDVSDASDIVAGHVVNGERIEVTLTP